MGDPHTITLNTGEILMGVAQGFARVMQNKRKGIGYAWNLEPGMEWQHHIEGALAEMALAEFLDERWTGTKGRGADDVAGGNEARVTHWPKGFLPLHKDDKDGSRYWLLTGSRGTYTVRGSILGREGKKEKWWKEPKPGRWCFAVPQEALEPVDNPVDKL